MNAGADRQGCLRREYFYRKETGAPLLLHRGGFSSDGHRLSSLYRNLSLYGAWLINRYAVSFLSKYSNSPFPKGANT